LILASKVGQSAADACTAFLSLAKKILPLMESILKGEASLPTSPQDRYAIAHCAIRRAIDLAGNDPEAAVAGGHLDPIIERVLLPLGPEMRIWSFSAAKAAGIPLELHRAQAQLQNLNL